MPLLTRKKVLTIDRNRITTLPTTLGSTANAQNIVLDAVGKLDTERIPRNFANPSLTAVKDLTGQKAVEFTFGIEMKGSNNGTDEPQWGKILDGCGFIGEAISKLSIGAITSGVVSGSTSTTFRHGELITGGTSGATARVVMDTHNGSAEIYYDTSSLLVSTFASGEVLTGQDSDAVATTSSVATNEGFAWWPISVVEKQILFDATGLEDNVAIGDLIEGLTSGARGICTRAIASSTNTIVFYTPVRGTFQGTETMQRISPNADVDIGDLAASTGESFSKFSPMGVRLYTDGKSITGNGCRGNLALSLEVNRPVRMDFTFRGTLQDTTDRVLLTGIDYENNDPPLWESSSIGYAQNETASESDIADEISPCLKTLSVDMGNQNADRKCAGAANGLLEVATSAREGTGSLTPEDTLEADIGWLTRIEDNETLRLRLTVGDVGTGGNAFTISMPGIQFVDHGEGDDEGIVTQDMSFRLTGGNLFDLVANNTLNAIGGDNEIIIIYHTS